MGSVTWLFVATLLMATYQSQVASVPSSLFGSLFDDVDDMRTGIEDDIKRMNDNIHKNVQKQLDQANKRVAEAIKNAKNGTQTSSGGSYNFFSSNNNMSVTSRRGGSRTVQSGTDAQGRPYYNEMEDLVIGKKLFHTERKYNPQTKKIDLTTYTKDLEDPNAQPVYIDPQSVPRDK
ncbi:uncharacterized protein LOC106648275 [Trichogramma pretiosum]|uniref:uncharacterized protein LOC106648275 n=1 Tax=Trichogramma pretiosum TaxID=7493 RepID=UPI0006C967ED|nr:uncharacterized protein LOC106648275 [Trichogramma pretiosum]